MPGVSIHVVDVSRGVVATGMEVELHAIDAGGKLELIAKGRVGPNGLVNEPQLSKTFTAGGYVASFHVADFYRAQGVALPDVPFLDVVRFHFGISKAVSSARPGASLGLRFGNTVSARCEPAALVRSCFVARRWTVAAMLVLGNIQVA